MRRLALLCLMAAVLADVLCARPGPASAARGLEVALQDDGVFVQQAWYSREAALVRARRLGVTRLRVNVLWARVETHANRRRPPRTPGYDWQAYDSLIADAARHGIRLQMTLVGPAPRWATADHRIGIVGPDPAAFARFAGDAAAHFAGRVDRYSIWNEPNWHTWLAPSTTCRAGRWGTTCDRRLGRLYRALYRRAYDAINRADASAQVLFGEFAPNARPGSATGPLTLLRDVTCSRADWRAAKHCAPLRADGFAHHSYAFLSNPARPYGGQDDVVLGSLGRLTRALDALAARRALRTPRGRPLDLYLTEHGYFASGHRRLPAATRAAWLARSFDLALRNRRVRQMLQYLLVEPPRTRDTFPTQIMTRGGRPTAPYRALAAWSQRRRHRIARPRPLVKPKPKPAPAPAPVLPPPPAPVPAPAGPPIPLEPPPLTDTAPVIP